MRDAEDLSDAALVAAARARDKEAFVVLLGRHRALLYALCRRVLGDPWMVEDALQEAILRALLGLDRLRRPERFGPWLGGIGLNVCRRLLSERARGGVSWDELCGGRYCAEPIDWRVGPAERAEQAELGRRVREAIAGIPHGQRSAVALFYLSGLTQAETAAQLGIDPGAVKTRLHKARRTLRQRLQAEWSERGERYVATATEGTRIPVQIDSVRKGPAGGDGPFTYCVILKESDGPRHLLIWIGQDAADAMTNALTKSELPRPLTYTVIGRLLDALDGRVREVCVTKLVDDVFYATVAVEGSKGTLEIDARPSDALNIALITGAPMCVEDALLNAAGIVGVTIDGEWRVRRFADGAPVAMIEVDAKGNIVRRMPDDEEMQAPTEEQTVSEPSAEQAEGR